MRAMPTPEEVLDTPMEPNDSGATTVRGYLVALAKRCWIEEEGFGGKRPFGNSGWKGDIERALWKAGHVSGRYVKKWDSLEGVSQQSVDKLIYAALDALAVSK